MKRSEIKNIRFSIKEEEKIQKYADDNYGGNFSLAVRKLIEKALGL